MSENLNRVLDRLQGLRRNSGGWVGLCPAHADRSPSLSIREENGRVLLHCFAGCSLDAICASLRIEIHELFIEPRFNAKPEPRIIHRVKKQIASIRSKLTRREQVREITVVLADKSTPEHAMARALALAVEGELTQIAFKEEVVCE